MKLKFLTLILVLSVSAHAQIHMRVHEKNKTVSGYPIASIDSVQNDGNFLIIKLKNQTFVDKINSNIDSVTHAVPVTNNLYDVIGNDNTLTKFKTGIDIGLLNPFPYALSGNYTVFAPLNTGLQSYGLEPATFTAVDNNEFFSYHTIQGKHTIADIPVGKNIKYFTMNQPADSVFITKFVGSSTIVFVNGVQVNNTTGNFNIPASNGVLHKLTSNFGVLFPPFRNIYAEITKTTYGTNSFRYDSIARLVARAAQADPTIITTLQSTVLTLIAPSNAAFTTFLNAIPAYAGRIDNIPPSAALSLLKDHMVIGRQFLCDFQIAGTTGLLSYAGANMKWGNAGTPTAPNYVFYYTTGVPMVDFDYMQTNGVIHQVSGILVK